MREPMARFYEGSSGSRPVRFGPRWANCFDPNGGVHINIQGDGSYQPPTWPEQPGELTKMLHFEVEVDDLQRATARAVELVARSAVAATRPGS